MIAHTLYPTEGRLFYSMTGRVWQNSNNCWNWTGTTRPYGYGSVWYKGKSHKAHRVMYEFVHGKQPRENVIDHLCRNRACINPEHLESVTPRMNVIRGEGLAAQNARKTHCPKGHEYTKANTRMSGNKRYCRACGTYKARKSEA